MKNIFKYFTSFRAKITLILVILMFFSGALSNFLIYEYSLKSQMEQLREKLMIIAQAIALSIDADNLINIPLNKNGAETPQYQIVAKELSKIKKVAPSIAYIYILAKTEKEGVLKFIIDIKPGVSKMEKPPALPGDEYDASRFPELIKAFKGPSADKGLVKDEWGVFMSGYAPIRDNNGDAFAILGIDMRAHDIYNVQKETRRRALFVLVLGVIFSIAIGILISNKVTNPIKELIEGTRRISEGDLEYKVKVGGGDEISELGGAFNKMALNLDTARKKLLNYFYQVMQSFVRILEARDPYTKGHSDRVTLYSEKIALKMNLPKEKLELLKEAALLHDIGKLGVQEIILNKEATLNDEEREIVKKHPAIGEDILKPVSLDNEILKVVRGHHERYDGKGYPDKIKGDDIDILTSIVAVADSYDAMTSHRAYRRNLEKDEAIKQLRENSGVQFNPKVVEAFIEILENEGV